VTNGQEFSQQKVYMYVHLKERKKKKYDRYEEKKTSEGIKLNLQLPGQL
jgi:hypothetical protein